MSTRTAITFLNPGQYIRLQRNASVGNAPDLPTWIPARSGVRRGVETFEVISNSRYTTITGRGDGRRALVVRSPQGDRISLIIGATLKVEVIQ